MRSTRRVLEEIRDLRRESRDLGAEMAREFKQTRAAIENNTPVSREILLELRDHRSRLDSIDRGVQSSVDGLLHVLDELRNGRGGPGPAPAA